jgi:UDP-N-acetylglucosamine 2-epimerase (non-hydrolysing)
MKTISVIIGTRPEAIKMSPVILALRRAEGIRCSVCVTAQHRQMLDSVLSIHGIVPDSDLDLMTHDQGLAELTARALVSLDKYLARTKPDMVLVQGDTTTALCGALAAFYRRIDVGHVEAGLRTGDLRSPWPEEANRVLISRLAAIHFAPTVTSRANLLAEGVAKESIYVTGNPIVDALMSARKMIERRHPQVVGLPDCLQPGKRHGPQPPRMVLVTGHRRESLDGGLLDVCQAIRTLARRYVDVHFVYPVHPNPSVREQVAKALGPSRVKSRGQDVCSWSSRVHLIAPLAYLPFVSLMTRSYLILTDSGGIQEEGPCLGKPVLVTRSATERPEGHATGSVRLVGTDSDRIVKEVSLLLDDHSAYSRMARSTNPFGDGRAGYRISRLCRAFLQRRATARE